MHRVHGVILPIEKNDLPGAKVYDPERIVPEFQGATVTHGSPKASEPEDPLRAALDVPRFQKRPEIPCPSWCNESLRRESEALAQEWSVLDQRRSGLVSRLESRLAKDPANLSVSRPGARHKEEYALLVSEIDLRGRTQDYFASLAVASRSEDELRSKAVQDARRTVESAVTRLMEELGIDSRWINDRLYAMVSSSSPVSSAMKQANKIDALKSRLNGDDQGAAILSCRKRMEVLAAELVAMC